MEKNYFDRLRCGEEMGINDPGNEDFDVAIKECLDKLIRYNSTSLPNDERRSLLSSILHSPIDVNTYVAPPFFCDLGFNIKLGKGVRINYNCVLLDCAEIKIGDNVMIGPGAKMFTAEHPLDHIKRRDLVTIAHPIAIGNDAWIGGGAIILPGVSIGDRSIVGAGTVVTKDIPSDVVVVGNPARFVKSL